MCKCEILIMDRKHAFEETRFWSSQAETRKKMKEQENNNNQKSKIQFEKVLENSMTKVRDIE